MSTERSIFDLNGILFEYERSAIRRDILKEVERMNTEQDSKPQADFPPCTADNPCDLCKAMIPLSRTKTARELAVEMREYAWLARLRDADFENRYNEISPIAAHGIVDQIDRLLSLVIDGPELTFCQKERERHDREAANRVAVQSLSLMAFDLGYVTEYGVEDRPGDPSPWHGHDPIRHQMMWQYLQDFFGPDKFREELKKLAESKHEPHYSREVRMSRDGNYERLNEEIENLGCKVDGTSGKPRYSIEHIRRLIAEIAEFNSHSLTDLELTEAGIVMQFTPEQLNEWRFVGLSNKDFVDMEGWNIETIYENNAKDLNDIPDETECPHDPPYVDQSDVQSAIQKAIFDQQTIAIQQDLEIVRLHGIIDDQAAEIEQLKVVITDCDSRLSNVREIAIQQAFRCMPKDRQCRELFIAELPEDIRETAMRIIAAVPEVERRMKEEKPEDWSDDGNSSVSDAVAKSSFLNSMPFREIGIVVATFIGLVITMLTANWILSFR